MRRATSVGQVIVSIFAFLLTAFFILFAVFFDADTREQTDDYTISAYDVEMVVLPDNSIRVKEVIDVDFSNLLKHGIFRTLPRNQKVVFQDLNGKTIKRHYDIQYEIPAAVNQQVITEGRTTTLILGNENEYVSSHETYTLNYKIHLGDDKISEFDQFYFNVLGDSWDTTISNFTCSIEFRKGVSQTQAYVYDGTSVDGEIISITDNKINYAYSGTINAFQALTIRAVLPEGYFATEKPNHNLDIGVLAILVLILIIGTIIFAKKNSVEEPVDVVEFSAPDGITPAEAGYVIDKKMNKSEISSLIVYWANKGFLSIDDSNKQLLVKKLKDSDLTFTDYEKNIFNAIFNKRDEFDLRNQDLSISNAVIKAKTSIILQHQEKTFSMSAQAMQYAMIFFSAIIFTLVVFFVGTRSDNPIFSFGFIVVLSAIMVLFEVLACLAITHKLTNSKLTTRLLVGSAIVCLLAIMTSSIALNFSLYTDSYGMMFVAAIVSLVFFCLATRVNLRTKEGNKLFGRLNGLRNYIIATEENRLKVLCKKEPTIFYSVLPYAYVLGVSDIWIKKFSKIDVPIPAWYNGNNLNNIYYSHIMLNSISTTNSFISPISANGSGRSGFSGHFGGGGGGFSGGGFGGGGGGSW